KSWSEKRICDGRSDQRLACGFSEPLIGMAGGMVRDLGSVAGRDWAVWSGGFLGEPADARDWSEDGAGGAARGGLPIGPGAGGEGGRDWNCGRAGGCDSRGYVAERFAVRRGDLGC